MSNGFLSKRVKRKNQSGITSDRYQFLGLDQAEPDLGDPKIGVSSIGANPYSSSLDDIHFLVSDVSETGKRYWVPKTTVLTDNVIQPGSITVRRNNAIIGIANSITEINFLGTGVTITTPASFPGAVTGESVDIDISLYYTPNAGFATEAQNVIGGIASVTTLSVSGVSSLGNLQISSGIVTYSSGIVTYYGDGSQLTGISKIIDYAGYATIAGYSTNAGTATYATTAGIATYATTAGIATYANNAGISTYATRAGIATYANTSGIATYATTAGIATYATRSGIATYANTAGIATYANNAGVSTYANNAGVSTYSDTAGIATYANNAGVSTYSDTAGIATYATSAGIATYAHKSGISTYADVAGIATYANNAGVSTFATSAGISSYISEWSIGANGTINYTFTGAGFTGTESNPTLYLVRGQKYKFNNDSGGLHPFRIQSTSNGSTGTQYNDGVVNNDTSDGTLTWDVRFNAPDILYYQCTVHSTMGGKIYVANSGIASDVSVYTTGIVTASKFYGDGSGLSNIISSQQYANVSGIATYATTAGIATYATTAGIATYANTAGIATYATSAGIATALQTPRIFQITGDVASSAISFDGSGNVSLAATIQPNSVSLGSDTTGSYVESITGVTGEIEVSGSGGETAIVTVGLPDVINVTGVNASGITTIATLGVTGVTTSQYLSVTGVTTSQYLSVTGVTTIATLGVTGVTTSQYLSVTGVTTSQTLNVSGNSTFSGNIDATSATFSGNVSIAGTLTYEDVTNIDSIGIITARSNVLVDGNVGINSSSPSSRLDVDGDAKITGVVTATSFIKSGGTSSEFLKADGSVDSNTYLTSYTETDTLDVVTGRGNTTSNGISVGILTATSGIQGVGIQSGGVNIATGIITAINFAGVGNTISYNESTKTVSITIDSGGNEGSGKFDTGISSSIYVSVSSGVGIGTTQTNDIFVAPGIAYSFPSSSGRTYTVESIHITNTFSNELYFVGVINNNQYGRKIPLVNRVVVPYQGAVELLDEPIVMNPRDGFSFQALSGTGSTATGIDGGLDAFIVYSQKVDTSYIGIGSTSISTKETEVYRPSLSPAVIQSIKLCNYNQFTDIDASISIYRGGTAGIVTSTGTRLGYLAYNITIPKNSTIELLQRPKYLALTDSILARSDSDGLSVYVSGRSIT